MFYIILHLFYFFSFIYIKPTLFFFFQQEQGVLFWNMDFLNIDLQVLVYKFHCSRELVNVTQRVHSYF